MTTKKTKSPKARPFKKFYCDRDEVFLLPANAFKVWMFYYRLEGVKREGWATLDTICVKCGLSEDTLKTVKSWLVSNGWLKQVGWHQARNGRIPVMQVTRGTIPKTTEKRGLSKGSRKNLEQRWKVSTPPSSGKFPPDPPVENSTPVPATASETFHRTSSGKFPARCISPDVDERTNPDVDGSDSKAKSVPQATRKKPKPPEGAVAEILDEGILKGWRLMDGTKVML